MTFHSKLDFLDISDFLCNRYFFVPLATGEVPFWGGFQPPKQQTRAAKTEVHEASEGGLTFYSL